MEDGRRGRIGRCATKVVAKVYPFERANVRALSQSTVDIHVMEKERSLLPVQKIEIFQNAKMHAC